MASGSAGRGQRGNDTVEYRVVRSHLGPLVKHSQHVMSVAANELYSSELISKYEHTEAINSSQPAYDRATRVMDSVLTKIERDSSFFCKFVESLRASELNDIATDLETALSQEKSHCPTLSSSSGLPQNVVTSSEARVALQPTTMSINNVVVTDSSPPQATLCYTSQASGHITDTVSSQSLQGTNFSISSSTDALPVQNDDREGGYEPSEMESFAANDSSTDMQPIEASSSPMALQCGLHEGGGGGAMQSSQVSSTSTDKDSSGVLPSYSSPQFGTSVDSQPFRQSLRQLTSGWRGQSVYKSSPVTGDVLEFCIKPELPLACNPLIDALSSPLHCPIKLMQIQRDSHCSGSSLPAPHEESSSSANTFPIQSTHTEEEDVINRSEAALHNMSSTANRHPLAKLCSVQSSCICHVKIQFLQIKLSHRMSEIEILKNEIEELEKNFDEERKRRSETLQEHVQLKAQREKVIKYLEDDIASRDELVRQLSEEKAEYEREIYNLQKSCQNAEEKQWIAEQKAGFTAGRAAAKEKENQARCDKLEKNLRETEVKAQEYQYKLNEKTRDFEEVKQIAEAYQAKIMSLESELKEINQRESISKLEYVRISYEMVKSEAMATTEACIAKKNEVARSTFVPKLKIRVEREGKKAALENDPVRAKQAEELAEKTKRLLCVSETVTLRKGSESDKNQGCGDDIRALDLVTPDKDTELLFW